MKNIPASKMYRILLNTSSEVGEKMLSRKKINPNNINNVTYVKTDVKYFITSKLDKVKN
jgi:hypothetical protein